KRFETEIEKSGLHDRKFFYFASLSCRTLVYKGMLTPEQVPAYFADDLGDELLASALCMFHSRFSTNTFPSWELAHPYRMISHNGEINTLRGNINWMRAREALFESDLYEPGDVEKLKPIIREGLSDTACLDNAVELLVKSGFGVARTMTMLIPEAWQGHETMSQVKQAFCYSLEDIKYILGPMSNAGEEAVGSMGTDTPLAVLSDRPQPIFNYFKQLFAQVTNPPLDAIREELVTSVHTGAGREGNLLM